MKEVFPAWDNCRQGLIKKQEQIPNPSGKFDGLSTFRSHYVPHKLIPTESCKPLNIAFNSSVPFDDVTIYSVNTEKTGNLSSELLVSSRLYF